LSASLLLPCWLKSWIDAVVDRRQRSVTRSVHAAVILQLQNLGVDQRQYISVEFGPSLLPTEQATTEAADILSMQGYEVLVGRPANGAAWRYVTIECSLALDLPTLRHHQKVIQRVIEQVGGQFDSDWQARVPD
jgi:hypothetical protein